MTKKKLAKRLLLSAMIAEGVHILALLALVLLQGKIKVTQNAPMGAREIFFFPIDNVLVAVLSLLVMGVLAFLMLPRLSAGAKQGKLPLIGMLFFGAGVPVLSMIGTRLQYAWYTSEKTSSMEYMISAECVEQSIEWVAPLLFIAAALFVAGSAIACCAKSE